MARPQWPTGMVLPAEAIRRIRDEQDAYDRDPQGYERRERAQQDLREEEARMEHEWYEDMARRAAQETEHD